MKGSNKKKTLHLQVANGIGLSGPYFLIPILMEYLIEEFGFRGGLFIYGGLCLHVVLTGFVMKDIKVLGKENQAIMLGKRCVQRFWVSDRQRICQAIVSILTRSKVPIRKAEDTNKQAFF